MWLPQFQCNFWTKMISSYTSSLPEFNTWSFVPRRNDNDLTPIFLEDVRRKWNRCELIHCGIAVLQMVVLWLYITDCSSFSWLNTDEMNIKCWKRLTCENQNICWLFFFMPATQPEFKCKSSQFHTFNVFANWWKVHCVLGSMCPLLSAENGR